MHLEGAYEALENGKVFQALEQIDKLLITR